MDLDSIGPHAIKGITARLLKKEEEKVSKSIKRWLIIMITLGHRLNSCPIDFSVDELGDIIPYKDHNLKKNRHCPPPLKILLH